MAVYLLIKLWWPAEHIVQLACTVFGTENALVALLEGEVCSPSMMVGHPCCGPLCCISDS